MSLKTKKLPKNKKAKKIILGITAIILLVISIVAPGIAKYQYNKENKINYVDFMESIDKGDISEITIDKSKDLVYFDVDGITQNTVFPDNDKFIEQMLLKGVDVKTKQTSRPNIGSIVQIVFFIALISILLKQVMDPEIEYDVVKNSDITFNDVAGLDEIKKDLTIAIDMFLDDKYAKAGAKVPKGILLEGPPGNGKTLLAKALAGESKINFIAVNACDMESKFVSASAAKIKKLFAIAKENSPCILFIDEIDAIGTKRSDNSDSVSKEFNSTLTALLNQLDGFNSNEGVFVLAATNRASSLDEALLRPGRFDKKFIISAPDRRTRTKLFEYYLKDKKIDNTITCDNLSGKTRGCSCAEITTIISNAIVNSVQNKRETLTLADFDKAIFEIEIKGHVCQEYDQSPREKKIIAYHEAGHALISYFYSNTVVSMISTQPTTSGAGGFTITKNFSEDLAPISDLQNQIITLYGGRAGEIILANGNKSNVSSGASADISQATKVATQYVLSRDAIDYNQLGDVGSKKLYQEVEKVLRDSSELALKILNQHVEYLYGIANALIQREFLSENEFIHLVEDISDKKSSEKNLIKEIKS